VSEVTALSDLLVSYADLGAALGSRQEAELRAGLPAERIAERLREEGLPAPAEVVAWFSWHDGCTDRAYVRLVPTFYAPLSLDEALDQRRDLLAFAVEAARDGHGYDGSDRSQFWWRPEWLPFAAGAGALSASLSSSTRANPPHRSGSGLHTTR
jgi:hypothetical protein